MATTELSARKCVERGVREGHVTPLTVPASVYQDGNHRCVLIQVNDNWQANACIFMCVRVRVCVCVCVCVCVRVRVRVFPLVLMLLFAFAA